MPRLRNANDHNVDDVRKHNCKPFQSAKLSSIAQDADATKERLATARARPSRRSGCQNGLTLVNLINGASKCHMNDKLTVSDEVVNEQYIDKPL